MKLLTVLKRVSKALKDHPCTFCLVGGHAASLYRSQERFTRDVDFAIVAKPESHSSRIAQEAISAIGLEPVLAYIPLAEPEKNRKRICLVTSAPGKGESKGIIDILLPDLPWVKMAVNRAQYNAISLGTFKVPVITPEDLIVAKSYAFRNSPDRFQDLDDIKEILTNVTDLDRDYLDRALHDLGVSLPIPVQKYAR